MFFQEPRLGPDLVASRVDPRSFAAVARDPLSCWDNLALDDRDVAVKEVSRFKAAGGSTIVDLTTKEFGRDPHHLKWISERTGVNIVMGTGHYIEATHGRDVDRLTADDLATDMIREITEGVGSSAIRAGVIGEIGCSGDITPAERKVLAAAAIAQRRTGVAIAVHPPIPDKRLGTDVLGILEASGADLGKVALCHTDHQADAHDYQLAMIERGCYLMFDRFGNDWEYRSAPTWHEPADEVRIRAISRLADAGYAEKILIGQDSCMKINLAHYGGRGYEHLVTRVLEGFEAHDVDRSVYERFLVDNPEKFFSMPARPADVFQNDEGESDDKPA